jgi:hypothetical protein
VATLGAPLWKFNLTRVLVIDVSDDYRTMQHPLPNDLYPVLKETWLPKVGLRGRLPHESLCEGYLYDWHDPDPHLDGTWYVGVVDATLAQELLDGAKSA